MRTRPYNQNQYLSYYTELCKSYKLLPFSGPPENVESDPETICKICLLNHHDLTNPFINLCICHGSMRFIHYECLKKWMAVKLSTKENEKKTVKSYNMKSFNCEICKTPYPRNILFCLLLKFGLYIRKFILIL